jgi:hypothetical protein
MENLMVFEKHKEKIIQEMHERFLIYKMKKKEETKTFSKRVEKAWKNINEIKPENDKKQPSLDS